ncbi:alpha-mannosidase 2C1 isoform X2 [Hydra vulgaris]|uniref:alpha-mannosidase n=1 Tax=Hydra vulgaris TaxID=6087 RepID=A0ABM4C2F7_HYDVU
MENNRPRIKNKRILCERIEKFISSVYFSDVNLYSQLYTEVQKVKEIWHYNAPSRISFNEASSENVLYEKTRIGECFGTTWSTHWFKFEIDLSLQNSWKGHEIRLRWNSGSEAMIWMDGKPIQGLTGGDGQLRTDFILTENCNGDEKYLIYIEMSASGMFGAGKGGMINSPDPNKFFTLSQLEIVRFNRRIYEIIRDLKILVEVSQNLDEMCSKGWKALHVGCDVVNYFQPPRKDSIEKAKILLDDFFGNVKLANSEEFTVHAIGHCHIDTAWLWPYEETIRKCGRSWSSVISLMRRYPNFTFACSQAAQFEWVKKTYPSLFKDIQYYSEAKQFFPTGGTWVEMDGNMPSGESFIRQFLYGQRFFKMEFGSYCDTFWLPDTFGYSAQLPQIIRQAGIKNFLTQKLSWSLINKFPHSSFIWQGIDGSKCLTHFPPADTYESSAGYKDILKTKSQNKDPGVVCDAMLLYGYGDGGGGPTEDMIENIERMASFDQPRVVNSNPTRFFESLENCQKNLQTWVGELYLELHQGTFTTQALIKKRNRKCEVLLHNIEFSQVWAFLHSSDKSKNNLYLTEITETLRQCWKNVLLNQFHDVLPGTSIQCVYEDTEKLYEVVLSKSELVPMLLKNIIHMNERNESGKSIHHDNRAHSIVVNCCSWQRKELVLLDNLCNNSENQLVHMLNEEEKFVQYVEVPSMGLSNVSCVKPQSVTIEQWRTAFDGEIQLRNENLEVHFNTNGQMTKCILRKSQRECLASASNCFCLYTDIPLYWDAWDVMPYNQETKEILNLCAEIQIIDRGPLRASFQYRIQISEKSYISQLVSLDAGSDFIRFDTEVEWHENRKLLKTEFFLNVHANNATYEIQMGHIQRPTHYNTSWDWAKHEVCGHKWVDMSEYNFGIALLNDCKYGFSAYGNNLQMSLLRSSKAPDEKADMGHHEFSYAFMPHLGSFQEANVIHRAYEFNNPLQIVGQKTEIVSLSLFSVDHPGVVLETVKMSEDQSGNVILRFYESFGGKEKTQVKSYYPLSSICRCNILEDSVEVSDSCKLVDQNTIELTLSPFEIVSLRCCFI